MAITPFTEAHAIGVAPENVQFGISPLNVPARVAGIATYDPLKTSVVDDVEVVILNEADAGDKFGFGFPLHRLLKKIFDGSNGNVKVIAIPQSETGTESDGEIEWTGTTTAAGKVFLRIGGELTTIDIPSGSDIEATSDLVVAAINALADTPVIAAKTAVTFETTFTSKAKGLEQDKIVISLNSAVGEVSPAGLTTVITDMTNGAGTPDIQTALDGMGTDDEANQNSNTDISHGYGIDTGTIDKIGIYVGLGNAFTGLYKKTVGRPFTCLMGDTDPGSAALTALQVITDARLTDRGNMILAAPDEEDIPTEMAAFATGVIAAIDQVNPAQNYSDLVLSTIGGLSVSAQRWTKNLDTRDIAVKSGISPTEFKTNQVFLQNVQTFFRPANIPTTSNGYKSRRSIAIIRNMLFKMREIFEAPAWQGITIVSDSSEVTGSPAKEKARSVIDVKTELNNFADFAFKEKSWIFDAAFPKKNSTVLIRQASNGFDVNFAFILSGESQVLNIVQRFDINIAAA